MAPPPAIRLTWRFKQPERQGKTEDLVKLREWMEKNYGKSLNERINGPGRAKLSLRGADLSKKDLRKVNFNECDLTEVEFTGSDLSHSLLEDASLHQAIFSRTNLEQTKLPSSLDSFRNILENIENTAKFASRVFSGLNIIAVYQFIVIFKADRHFLLNEAEINLPLVGSPISIIAFVWIAPILALLTFLYFHSYYRHCCELIAQLPRVFPDGLELHKKIYPWLPNIITQQWQGPTEWEDGEKYSPSTWSWWRSKITHVWLFWFAPIMLFAIAIRITVTQDLYLIFGMGLVFVSCTISALIFYSKNQTILRGERFAVRKVSGFPALLTLVGILAISLNLTFFSRGDRRWSIEPVWARADLENEILSTKQGENSWTGPNFRNASLRYANFRNTHIEWGTFLGSDLANADFTNSNANRSNFTRAVLKYADFYPSNLREANFSVANLYNANLSMTSLQGAILVGANLRESQLIAANLEGAILNNAVLFDEGHLTPGQICKAKRWEQAILRGDEGKLMCEKGDPTGPVVDIHDFKPGPFRLAVEQRCPSGVDYRHGWPGFVPDVQGKHYSDKLVPCRG